LMKAIRRQRAVVSSLLAGLALILAFNAIDLLPNGLATSLPYFYAGGLTTVLRRSALRQPG
jgi:hypothetical protein